MGTPLASVVIPLCCEPDQALACLAGIAAQDDAPEHEVIIVHDGSAALRPLLRQVAGDVIVLTAAPWPGAARAALLGAGHAQAPTIVTVENHAIHGPGWLSAQLLRAAPVPGSAPELTVVIPTLDVAAERARDSIRALRSATPEGHVIVTVDNGWPAQGFSGPVNAGLRAADTPYVVVMNDDVEPLPGWWPPLRQALDAGAAVVFPTTVDGRMRHDFAAWCFAMTTETIAAFSHAPGAFFDPDLVVWYQDTDLLFRLRRAGMAPVEVTASAVRHGLSQTVNKPDPGLRAWIVRQTQADRAAFVAKHPDAILNGHELAA